MACPNVACLIVILEGSLSLVAGPFSAQDGETQGTICTSRYINKYTLLHCIERCCLLALLACCWLASGLSSFWRRYQLAANCGQNLAASSVVSCQAKGKLSIKPRHTPHHHQQPGTSPAPSGPEISPRQTSIRIWLKMDGTTCTKAEQLF